MTPDIKRELKLLWHKANQQAEHDATIRNELVSKILTRITEAQYDKSTMQDFINYIESLRTQEHER